MNETIAIAKVRKETKVTVPAGGYIIVAGPDKPFHEAVAARVKLINDGEVNEEIETLIVGRVHNHYTNANFITAAQKIEREKRLAAAAKSMSKSHKDAIDREEKTGDAARVKEAKDHAKRVKEINRQNDSIRAQGVPAPAAKVESEEVPPKEGASGEEKPAADAPPETK